MKYRANFAGSLPGCAEQTVPAARPLSRWLEPIRKYLRLAERVLPLVVALASAAAAMHLLTTLVPLLPTEADPTTSPGSPPVAAAGDMAAVGAPAAAPVVRLEPAAGPAQEGASSHAADADPAGPTTPHETGPADVAGGEQASQPASGPLSAGTDIPAEAERDPGVLADVVEAVRREKAELARARAELELRERIVQELIRQADDRLAQMQELANRLEELTGKIDAEEEARLQDLVTLYEAMKPKQAARIFDQLELSTLLRLARRMRETKLASIVAAMDPQRAKELTIELGKESKAPQPE